MFLEIKKGPFDSKDTIFPEWGPEEGDSVSVKKYLNNLEREVKSGSLHT